jgi:hypothetical protein
MILQSGDTAYRNGRLDNALSLYQQARGLGCNAPNLNNAISGVEQQIQQQRQRAKHAQQCNDLVQRGNAANNAGRAQDALNFYRQARQGGCQIQGLDNAIAGLERQIEQQRQQAQQAQRCNDFVQRGTAANNAGRPQDALSLYRQAKQGGCQVPGLDQAIAGLEARIRAGQRPAAPGPRGSGGVVFDRTPIPGLPGGDCSGVLGQGDC